MLGWTRSLADRIRDPRVLYATVTLAVLLSARSFATWDAPKVDNGMIDLQAC
jgi:hypothetical protein